ncbi:hypothetical protein CIB48_g2884 [Xylaria polymorpha]|nr:hypothetical protein CIB48_g2884 [Xylaria polymorpha]
MRTSQLAALCLSMATFALAQDPSSNGIRVENHGAYSGWVYVKASGKESRHSGLLNAGQDASFSFEDLYKNGFKVGDNCWMSVDVEAGPSDHESAENFKLGRYRQRRIL